MNKNIISKNYGALLVFISALMFGSYGVWSRLIGHSFSNFFQGWTRALIILILLVPIALFKKEIIKIDKKDRKWLVIFMLFTSLTQAPLFYAFNHINIGSASLLFFVSMFLTMNIIGILFLNEQFTKIKIVSSIIAVIGLCFIFSFSISSFTILAVIMAIINGIASGGEVAFSKKLSNTYSPLYLVILSWFIILITNGITSNIIGETQIIPSLSMPWFWQICYSIASLLAFWLVLAGIKHIDVGVSALIGLMEIVFSVVFGIIIFKETLTISVGIGAILIITAATLPNLYRPSTNLKGISP